MNWDKLKIRLQQDISKKELEVNIDEIWAAIEPEVDALNEERRRKRFFFFWMMGIGLVVTLSSLFYFANNSTTENKRANTEILTRQIESTKQKVDVVDSKNEISQQDIYKTNTKSESVRLNENIEASNSNITSSGSGANTIEKDILQKDFERNNVLPLGRVVVQNTDSQASTTLFSEGKAISNSKQVNRLTSGQVLNLDHIEIGGLNESQTDSQKKKPNTLKLSIANISSLSTLLPVEERMLDFFDQLSSYYLPLSKEQIEEILFDEMPPMKQPKFTFSLGAVGGLGNAARSLQAKEDTVGIALLDVRKATESSLETSILGLTFSAHHRSGLHFTTGIQRTRFVEKAVFNNAITEEELVEGLVQLRIDLNGDTIPVYGLIPETTTHEIEKKFYSRYTLLEVPLLLGYQTNADRGQNWSISVQLGIVPNIALKTTGNILNEDYSDFNIDTNQSTIFKSNIGLSYQVAFSVNRKIGENIELSFAPTIRFFPNDFSVAGYPLIQKYNLFSGNLGVRYVFD